MHIAYQQLIRPHPQPFSQREKGDLKPSLFGRGQGEGKTLPNYRFAPSNAASLMGVSLRTSVLSAQKLMMPRGVMLW